KRSDVVQHLGSRVAVRHESANKSCCPGLLENLDRPLAGDEWFVVTGDDEPGIVLLRDSNQAFRSDVSRRSNRVGIAQGLRGDPVLTVAAVKVASEHSEGECE